MKKVLTVSVFAGLLLYVGLSSASPPKLYIADRAASHHRSCTKLFTVKMAKVAAKAVYRGHRNVTTKNLKMLTKIKFCQRNRAAERFIYHYYQSQRSQWKRRVYEHTHPWNNDGWFTEYFPGGGGDNGGTDYACGGSYVYGDMVVANSQLPCGTKVELEENGRTANVIVEDRFGGDHPVGNFDLTPAVADQLGCTCSEPGSWRLGWPEKG